MNKTKKYPRYNLPCTVFSFRIMTILLAITVKVNPPTAKDTPI